MTYEIMRQKETGARALVKKWGKLLPPNSRWKREIAQVLENQSRWFDSIGVEMPERMPSGEILRIMGSDWRVKVLRAIARGMDKCPLMEMVSVQPFNAPIGLVCFEVDPGKTPLQELVERVYDGYTYQLVSQEVRAEPRKSKMRIRPDRGISFQHILDYAFEKFFREEIVYEVLGTILNAAEAARPPTKTTLSGLPTDLQWALKVTHRDSGRSSADWAVTRRELADEVRRLQPGLKVHEDKFFPEGKILLFRSPTTPFDADLIYSPYLFQFDQMRAYPVFNTDQNYAGRVRHKITVTSNKGSYVLEVI